MSLPANAAQSYRRVAAETATPAQRVTMLYDGAVRFLERALRGLEHEDPLERNQSVHNNIARAQDIIHELNGCLNMEAGGELAAALRRLYLYFDWRLDESNRQKNSRGIEEVMQRLGVLRDAWAEMVRQRETASTGA